MSEEFVFDTSIIYPNDPSANPERIEQYKEYYAVKYYICKHINPKVIVDIGVRAGYSGWTFLQACPDAKYIGIDDNSGTHGGQGGEDGSFARWAEQLLKDYDCEFIWKDTRRMIPEDIPYKVDLFYVDGDHTRAGVKNDLSLAYTVLSAKGFILVDDIIYLESVHTGVTEWLKRMDGRVETQELPSLRGEMLIWPKRDNI